MFVVSNRGMETCCFRQHEDERGLVVRMSWKCEKTWRCDEVAMMNPRSDVPPLTSLGCDAVV